MQRCALIFDFDGTIAPSEEQVYAVWREFFESRGCGLPVEVWSRCIGTSEETVDLGAYAEERGLGEREEIKVRLGAAVVERCADLPTNPGVRELIAAANDGGLPLGVASSSPSRWVEGHLSRLGLRRHFGSVRTRDHGPTKPSPYLYERVLDDLDARPAGSWAIEDSGPGVASAKAAGLRVVAVPNPLTRCHDLAPADLIVDCLTEVTVERLGLA